MANLTCMHFTDDSELKYKKIVNINSIPTDSVNAYSRYVAPRGEYYI